MITQSYQDMITMVFRINYLNKLNFFKLSLNLKTGYTSSSVGEEKKYNPRLTQSKEDFCKTMKNLQLDLPKLIDLAVPANMVCGIQDNLFKQKQ